jgi:hypothetical protein
MKILKAILVAIVIGLLTIVFVPNARAGVNNYDNQPSPAFTYCVTAAYNSQFTTTIPPQRCYGDYTDFVNFANSYQVNYVTFYADANLSGYRLAYVGNGTGSNDPCVRGVYAYNLPIGWNDQISSSRTRDGNCSFVGLYHDNGFRNLMYSCGWSVLECNANYSSFNGNDKVSSVAFGNS